MTRFSTAGLEGWIRPGRADRQVLLLHGGPGLNDYMRWLADDLDDWTCAGFQQRGIAPSTTEGPYDVATAVDDIATVLDHLAEQGWERPLVAGHSWGGHLAWHVAARLADRVGGVLAIDPLGAVGDLGLEAFGQELTARVPPELRDRLDEIDAHDVDGTTTDAEAVEQMVILWPCYFADAAAAPPMPELVINEHANQQLVASALEGQPTLEAALRHVAVPLGAVHGSRSPMPTTAASEATDLVEGAWTEIIPDAGHFVWHEAPGAVAAALERLRSG